LCWLINECKDKRFSLLCDNQPTFYSELVLASAYFDVHANRNCHGRKALPRKVGPMPRIADGLSLNNPGKSKLMELAEDFLQRAKELEAQEAERQQQPAVVG
jgi:hypothetical protein